ncbi:MAG: hypothetical protein K2L83_04675 [Muribaculaceae bacterium]|nr:hypothetical protein [Muribaculaceae bacterium]
MTSKHKDFRKAIGRAAIAMLAAGSAMSASAAKDSGLAMELNRVYGTSDLAEVRPLVEEARKAGGLDGWFYSAKLAMLDFNYAEAQRCYGEFKKAYARLPKNKAALADYPFDPQKQIDELQSEIEEGRQQFDRFRDIVVIDAVEVDRDDFFRHLRLPLSAGRVVGIDEVPVAESGSNSRGETAFISEDGDFMMWGEEVKVDPDDDADEYAIPEFESTIAELNRLADGSYSEPRYVDGLGDGADFPFLSADGTMLYYSATGENSAGGRDIFVASRDPQTGEYLQPVNAGFPFNSAADDYMMAIDEENGVGWWATDRHMLPDNKIMLYVYILSESRVNFAGSDEEKRERALLDDIRVTWRPSATVADESDDDEEELDQSELEAAQAAREKGYETLADEIRAIEPGQKPRRHDCRIPLPGLKYIYSEDDVATQEQKSLVADYIRLEKQLAAEENELDTLRRNYASAGSQGDTAAILRLEKSVADRRLALTAHLSRLYRSLGIGK